MCPKPTPAAWFWGAYLGLACGLIAWGMLA